MLDSSLIQTVPSLHPEDTHRAVANQAAAALARFWSPTGTLLIRTSRSDRFRRDRILASLHAHEAWGIDLGVIPSRKPRGFL